jgi:hypothetical protein
MDPPDPAVTKRIAALRERTARQERERERLETLERDLDPSAQGALRLVPIAILALLCIAAALIAGAGRMPRPSMVLSAGLITLAAVAVGRLALRRVLLTNAFNHTLGSLVVASIVALCANRVLGVLDGTPVPSILVNDLLLLASFSVAGAVSLFRGLGWCALTPVLGIVATRIWPERAAGIFIAANIALLFALAWVLPRRRDRSSSHPR